jgi:hypothetical protein
MIGMSRTTGKALSGDDHLRQSVTDILTTPLGTRVMRRDYGSLLFELLDRPLNAATKLLCVMATATALARWEPRIAVKQVLVDGTPGLGQIVLTVIGTRTDSTDPTALTRLSIPIT